ncbi:MAG: hypothetical protein ABFD52_08915 [Acidobacteriota bacterium]
MKADDEIVVDIEELNAVERNLKFVLPASHPFATGLSGLLGGKKGIPQDLKDDFWTLYEKHKSVILYKPKILFITVKVYVHTLRPLFVLIFGKPK